MTHLPHRIRLFERETGFVSEAGPAGLIMNRSTARRVAPTGTNVFTVFHNARDGRIASGIREHLRAARFVVLSVVIDKRNTFLVVELTSLLAVRTSRLGIND